MLEVVLVGLVAGGESGVPRYAASLASAIDRAAPVFPDLAMRMLTTPRGAQRSGMRNIPVDLVGWPFAESNAGLGRIVGEQIASRAAPGGLLHFFDLSGPVLAPRRRFVTTIHDAAVGQGFERARVAHKLALQPWAARRATRAVAVSEFAREEAIRHFGADRARTAVIHSGPGLVAGGGVGPAGGAEANGPYLLYVGNLSAHKNLVLLIAAFDLADVPATRLLLVGGRGERFDEIEAAVASARRSADIEIRKDVGDGELDALYRGARALLLPSIYEGFGFTALEAMGRDCPVIASDIPALREISGEGAMLLPPADVSAWSAAIREVAGDDSVREDLRRRGRAQVERYSWDATARSVCELFLEAGG
jgi:glycosyltransferase involved in cell wall biosynthesis